MSVPIINICAETLEDELKWMDELKCLVDGSFQLQYTSFHENPRLGDFYFLDDAHSHLKNKIQEIRNLSTAYKPLCLMTQDESLHVKGSIPHEYLDDYLVYPFRRIEVFSKLKNLANVKFLKEIEALNQDFSFTLNQLKKDLEQAAQIHKNFYPKRFVDLKGLHVHTRFIAGEKSGGDHCEVLQSEDQNSTLTLVSDSSSFGLSAAVISSVGHLMAQFLARQKSGCSASDLFNIVKPFFLELKKNLSEHDELSIFLGVLDRRNYSLKYIHFGFIKVYVAQFKSNFEELMATQVALTQTTIDLMSAEGIKELQLEPQDRIVIITDGFAEVFNHEREIQDVLNLSRDKESLTLLNEFGFEVKKKMISPSEDFAAQDATAVAIDLDAKVLRLMRNQAS